jgi:hypothetical protein
MEDKFTILNLNHRFLSLKILVFLLILIPYFLSSQRILQLEMVNDPETMKYYEGMEITFKIKGSDEWLTRTIEIIMINEQAIVFNEGFYKLDEITAIQNKRFGVLIFSSVMTTFGTAWLGFGAIEELAFAGKQHTAKTWIIGGTAALLGYGMRKLFYKHNKKLNSGRYRLRLLELSMY